MLSHVTPWTAARQAPLSMDFSRQEYWSGLPFPSPGKNSKWCILETKKWKQNPCVLPSQGRKGNNIVVTTPGKQKLEYFLLCQLLFLNFPYRHLWIKSRYKTLSFCNLYFSSQGFIWELQLCWYRKLGCRKMQNCNSSWGWLHLPCPALGCVPFSVTLAGSSVYSL